MRQWIGSALVQTIACAYSAPIHYLNQRWTIVKWDLRNKLQVTFNQNTKRFINKNASENVICNRTAILSRERWVYMYFITCVTLSKLLFHHLCHWQEPCHKISERVVLKRRCVYFEEFSASFCFCCLVLVHLNIKYTILERFWHRLKFDLAYIFHHSGFVNRSNWILGHCICQTKLRVN